MTESDPNSPSSQLRVIAQSYELYFQRVSQENLLINNRTGWLITIQSFMIAGVSVTYSYYMQTFVPLLKKDEIAKYNLIQIKTLSYNICDFMLVMCSIGAIISVIVAYLVWTASDAIESLEKEWDEHGFGRYSIIEVSLIKFVPGLTNGSLYQDKRPPGFINIGKQLSIAIPVIFAVLWTFIFVVVDHGRVRF